MRTASLLGVSSHGLWRGTAGTGSLETAKGRSWFVRPFLVGLSLLMVLPSAHALSQEGTERLIRDVGWSYDQVWIFFAVFGEDVFALENATVLPLAYAVDNQTARAWPIVFTPIDWAFLISECAEIVVLGGEPTETIACTLRAPGPELTPVNVVMASAPGEILNATTESAAGTILRASTLAEHSSSAIQIVIGRWTTDILALVP
jgi:hypothetical protein